jgi:hypothetical protein
MDCMELHGLELCIRMAMAGYIDEDRLMRYGGSDQM